MMRKLLLAVLFALTLVPAFAQAPPPVPALPDTERRTSYSISSSTCSCSVGFALFGDSTDVGNWIEVFLNGALVPSTSYAVTSPTGPLATIPRPITDAVLTFNTAQTGTVQIVGARRPRRTSQFSENRGVAARDLNQAITDIIAMLREDWDKINDVTGRAVLAPPGETLALLPAKANRQNQGACFDNNGNLVNCVGIPSSAFSAGTNITFTGTNPTTISAAGYSATITGGTGISTSGTCTSSTSINCTLSVANSNIIDPKAGRFLPIIVGTVSGTSCSATSPFTCMQFCVYRGNTVLVNGVSQTIPAGQCVASTGGVAGAYNQACIENGSFVTTCGQTLAANTLYYAYVGMVSSTLTMIWSTNQHCPSLATCSSTYGNEVMSGDQTRSLVGMCQTDASGKFVGTANRQNCASWFNPVWDGLQLSASALTFNNAAAYTDITNCAGNANNCLTWVQFSDNVPTVQANCVLNQNSGSTVSVTVGIGLSTNGSAATVPTEPSQITVETGNLFRQVAVQSSGAIGSDGYVISNLLGLPTGSNPTITTSSCKIGVGSRIPS